MKPSFQRYITYPEPSSHEAQSGLTLVNVSNILLQEHPQPPSSYEEIVNVTGGGAGKTLKSSQSTERAGTGHLRWHMKDGLHQVTQDGEGKSRPSLQKDWPDKARLQR